MNDSMNELSPKPTEVPSTNAVEASVNITVSDRFKGLGEKARSVARMVTQRTALTGAALVLLISSGCSNAEQPNTPTPVEPTPISTPVETATPTQEELLAKHQARLIELSNVFTEEGKYPQEEVNQWLKAAGITWDTLTVHGLPYSTMIRKQRIGDKEVPSEVVLSGTNIKVTYPAYIEYPSSHNYSSNFSRLGKATEAKLDGGNRTAWTNVRVNDPTGAFILKIDGTNIPQLSPK